MNKRFLPTALVSVAFLAILIFGVLVFLYGGKTIVATNTRAASNSEEGQEIKDYVVKNGDTFSSVMESFGLSGADVEQMLAASKQVYDFTTVKSGQIFRMVFIQRAFAAVEYVVTDHKMVIVERKNDDFSVTESDIAYDIEPAVAEATITSSLFLDASAAGLPDKTIMELAEIFGWDIDFATDLREGDSFKVLYEKRSLEGEPAKPGNILAARFVNQGQEYWAIGYEIEPGNLQYYDQEGNALAKQFLKSPLTYKYISTQYTNSRINPVTKTLDTHKAIDYAAPSGTPIVAAADGTITYSGWKGGYGIDVEIEHPNSYKTLYAHLSRIADGIKNGVKVQQGQVIGYVGSTGISTGPHLHFAMYKNENPLNPLTAEFPQGKPLSATEKRDFAATKNKLQEFLR